MTKRDKAKDERAKALATADALMNIFGLRRVE